MPRHDESRWKTISEDLPELIVLLERAIPSVPPEAD